MEEEGWRETEGGGKRGGGREGRRRGWKEEGGKIGRVTCITHPSLSATLAKVKAIFASVADVNHLYPWRQ